MILANVPSVLASFEAKVIRNSCAGEVAVEQELEQRVCEHATFDECHERFCNFLRGAHAN